MAQLTTSLGGGPRTLLPLSLVNKAVEKHRQLDQQTWPGVALVKDFLEVLGGASG